MPREEYVSKILFYGDISINKSEDGVPLEEALEEVNDLLSGKEPDDED